MNLIGRLQGGPREGSVPERPPLEATVTTAPQLHRSSTPTLQTPVGLIQTWSLTHCNTCHMPPTHPAERHPERLPHPLHTQRIQSKRTHPRLPTITGTTIPQTPARTLSLQEGLSRRSTHSSSFPGPPAFPHPCPLTPLWYHPILQSGHPLRHQSDSQQPGTAANSQPTQAWGARFTGGGPPRKKVRPRAKPSQDTLSLALGPSLLPIYHLPGNLGRPQRQPPPPSPPSQPTSPHPSPSSPGLPAQDH